MKSTLSCLVLFQVLSSIAFSQEITNDSLQTLEGVTIKAFEQNRKPLSSTANVRILRATDLHRNNNTSFVQAFNTITGVRMEERSPGSYRINIRGSSLRSPFGVRNVKMYWNDIPLTDPGGNTYFNQFSLNNFSSIEVFKGPAGSLYGAGTGGLVLAHSLQAWHPGIKLEYTAGSFDMHSIFAGINFGNDDRKNQVTYAYTKSDGYRTHTAMRRHNASWTSQLKVSGRQQLLAAMMFSDMYYQTPGALTLAEFENNPKAARPAAGAFPSSVDARAAIYQKTALAGLSNQYHFAGNFQNLTSLYGAFAQVKNPAVRNYERRNEPHFGGRTRFIYTNDQSGCVLQLVGGGEFQQGYFNTRVANNRAGNPDTIQTNDDISYSAITMFFQADLNLAQRWIVTAGVSSNQSKVEFARLSSYPVQNQSRKYKNEIAPRLSLLRQFGNAVSLVATVSKGFSPPTIGELLPSTGIISTDLEAEKGINYEFTARYQVRKLGIYLEATGFYFKLKDALVQRRDLSGADFFVNAGEVKQKGVELHGEYRLSLPESIVSGLAIKTDYTYNHFRYGSFIKGTNDFTGKAVPSVPDHTLSILADATSKAGFYISVNYYSASRIWLNDANSFFAKPYHLLGSRIGLKRNSAKRTGWNIYAGVDNLLDEVYSLGNDINAAANRFYNAAPGRNFFAGVALQWMKAAKN